MQRDQSYFAVTTRDPINCEDRWAEVTRDGLFWTDDPAFATIYLDPDQAAADVRKHCDPIIILSIVTAPQEAVR